MYLFELSVEQFAMLVFWIVVSAVVITYVFIGMCKVSSKLGQEIVEKLVTFIKNKQKRSVDYEKVSSENG